MYWDKYLIRQSHAQRVTFQEVVSGARELLCAYACALMIARMCQNFHHAKKFVKKFLLAKNFHVYGPTVYDGLDT